MRYFDFNIFSLMFKLTKVKNQTHPVINIAKESNLNNEVSQRKLGIVLTNHRDIFTQQQPKISNRKFIKSKLKLFKL